MKRNLNENSTRSTAGCLPVPLFHQKKRNRQPLTSNPLKNDPGISSTFDNYDFSPLPTDWAWEAMNPELASLTKTVNTGQITSSVSCPLRSQDSMPKSIQSNTETRQSAWSYRDDNKNTSSKTWGKNDFRTQCKRTNLVENDGIYSSPVNLGAQQQKQLRISEPHNLTYHRKTEEIPLCQLQFKEKNNSLRIISAVIESMKYWREHAQKTVLLFEILAVLDSAVTPGPYYSKAFLMRDGKNTLPCVFYEIDRELPRLIRGQVHRCVGSYDLKKNIFRCVSVRPASVYEQKTFQAFVKIVDAEMRYYTKVMNEI
ncbi:spermatogenesis-associated protein 22 isoform X2 [Heterocephalus glaber]|uniref:Spermatogenesis-associated protein 22 isoform X2 n=1 Tax=Heterocephalus glaber TaxID=10181 RepID=A0AAX6PRE7_HETGA|nr:spermatogenesis-associated protein 22 isoform X2 [Heterocephalus glaber]